MRGVADVRTALALQFGHGVEAVDDVRRVKHLTARDGLQFGHGVEAVDETRPAPWRRGSTSLQFGHGVEAVDDFSSSRRMVDDLQASIRPRR